MEMGKLTCPQLTLPNEIQMVSVLFFFCCLSWMNTPWFSISPWLSSRALKQLILVNFVQCSLWLYDWEVLTLLFSLTFLFLCDFWRLCHVAQNFTLAVVFLQRWKSVTNYVLVSIVSTEKSAISLTVLVLKLAWPFFMALSKIYFLFVFGGSLL